MGECLAVASGECVVLFALGVARLLERARLKLPHQNITRLIGDGPRLWLGDAALGWHCAHVWRRRQTSGNSVTDTSIGDGCVLVVEATDPVPSLTLSAVVADSNTLLLSDRCGSVYLSGLSDEDVRDLSAGLGRSSVSMRHLVRQAGAHIGDPGTCCGFISNSLSGVKTGCIGTVSGALWSLTPVASESVSRILMTLQGVLATEYGRDWVGGDVVRFRSRHCPAQGVVDVDFCERYFTLDTPGR